LAEAEPGVGRGHPREGQQGRWQGQQQQHRPQPQADHQESLGPAHRFAFPAIVPDQLTHRVAGMSARVRPTETPMSLTITTVDAFTARPFAGNPAAVCVRPGPADDRWMQQVAREINLSATAFLYRQPDGFSLRWFTPAVEVKLCGHAT